METVRNKRRTNWVVATIQRPDPKMKSIAKKLILYFPIFFILCGSLNVFAEEIFLNNGDRITGQIIEETEESITIDTEALGTLTIEKTFLEKEEVVPEPAEEAPEESPWKRKFSVGYSQT